MKNNIITPKSTRQAVANARTVSAAILAASMMPHAPADDGTNRHERIVAANASLFVEANFSEPLTAYARGWRDPDVEGALEFYAPMVRTADRFEYATFSNAEEWFSDATDDDLRAIKGDFKEAEYTSGKVNAKTENRGLRIVLDYDQIKHMPNWQQFYTGKLIRRLKRNALRRAVALLSAAATNTAKTWDTTAGKDPDQDVVSDLVTAADSGGVRPNRIGYGDTSWSKRLLSHRAQNTAGGFASAGLTEEQLSAFLGVDQVHRTAARYQSAAATKTQVVANLVLMFNAQANLSVEDPSNIKRFVSATQTGGDMAVYVRQISTKLWEIVVEHYELQAITSTLGIRKFTVS